LKLNTKYREFDAYMGEIRDEEVLARGCRCSDVITGRINPNECPMFGNACTPVNPKGACMVSSEGACGIWYGAKEATK
jgi:hydrogenase expression/formation protein HypD